MIGRKSITWRYYVFSFLLSLSFYTAVLVPFYTEWGHISLLQVQILQSWFMFWAFVMEIPTGVIADKYGRKHSVALGCMVIFFATLLYGLVPSYSAFLTAEFFNAVGLALISGAGEALLYDSLKEENNEKKYKQIMGKTFSLDQVAVIATASLGGLIAAKWGLNIPMLVSAIPYFIAALIIYSAREPVIKSVKEANRGYLEIAKTGIKFFKNNKVLRTLVLNGIIVYLGVYFIVWLYQPMLLKMGVDIKYFGLIRSLFALAGMITSGNIQITENIFKKSINFMNYSAIISIISLILVAIFPGIITIVLAIIVFGGLGQARFLVINSNINNLIPSEQRATILSAGSMLNRIVLIILNPLLGFIADHTLPGAFIVLALLTASAFIITPLKKQYITT